MIKKEFFDAAKLGALLLPIVSFLTSALYYSAFFMPFELLSVRILSFQDYLDKVTDLALLNIAITIFYAFCLSAQNSTLEKKNEKFWPNEEVKLFILSGIFFSILVGFFVLQNIIYVHFIPLVLISFIVGPVIHKYELNNNNFKISIAAAVFVFLCMSSVIIGQSDIKRFENLHTIEFYDIISSGELTGQSGTLTFKSNSTDKIVVDRLTHSPRQPLSCVLFEIYCKK